MKTQLAILACVVSLTSCAVPRALLQVCPHVRYIKTELPLTFVGYESRYAAVTVGIQGHEYRLILDTGSPNEAIALTREALANLDVRYTGKARVFRDAYGSRYESREFVIPSMELGDLELRNVVGNERHRSVYGLDGAIGLELLDRFDVLIDYSAGMLTLYRPEHEPAFVSDGSWFRYSYEGNLCMQVQFDFLDGEHELCLDSGCGCNFVGSRSRLGRTMSSALEQHGRPIAIGGGTRDRCPSYMIDHLYLGGRDIGGGHFVLGDLPSYMNNGVVGYDFFANNLVYIRFWKREIWLKRTPTAHYRVVGRRSSQAGSGGVSASIFGHRMGPESAELFQTAPVEYSNP